VIASVEQPMAPSRTQRYDVATVPGAISATQEGDALCAVASPTEMRDAIYARAHRRAFELARLKGWTLLRGALIDIGERRILLIGPRREQAIVGLRLALSGAQIQGTDSVWMRDGLLFAVPAPLTIEDDAAHEVPQIASQLAALPRAHGLVILDPARDLGLPWRLRIAPVDHVVLLESAEGAFAAESGPASAMLVDVARGNAHRGERDPKLLEALHQALAGAQGHRLRGADAFAIEDAIRAVAC
jgi:hypothetical protein